MEDARRPKEPRSLTALKGVEHKIHDLDAIIPLLNQEIKGGFDPPAHQGLPVPGAGIDVEVRKGVSPVVRLPVFDQVPLNRASDIQATTAVAQARATQHPVDGARKEALVAMKTDHRSEPRSQSFSIF
jgi:hypothetical protein